MVLHGLTPICFYNLFFGYFLALYSPKILETLNFSVYPIISYLLGFANAVPSEKNVFPFLILLVNIC